MHSVNRETEQKLFKRFFPLVDTCNATIDTILTEPRYSKISLTVKDYIRKWCDEFVDPATFIEDFLVDYDDMVDFECQRCHMELQVGKRKSVSYVDETPILGIVMNLDNGNIYPFNNPNTITPKKDHIVHDVNEQGDLAFRGGMYLNRIGDLNTAIRSTEKGAAFLLVKRVAYTDIPHDSVDNKIKKRSFIQKIMDFINPTEKQTYTSNTSLNIYYSRWGNEKDIDFSTIGGNDFLMNPARDTSFLIEYNEPKVSCDVQNFRNEWEKMLVSGKGKFTITVKGVKEDEDDKDGSVPEDSVSE